jgi:tetratricopeptide (TPR) repeat protein
MKKNRCAKKIFLGLVIVVTAFSGAESKASPQGNFDEAMAMVRSREYVGAATALFQLARRSELRSQKGDIHLVLGKVLLELKMPQIAAWQFVNVITINDTRNYHKAVELLLVAADELGDKTILNYAISKIKISDFPEEHRDMLYFRLGEVKFDAKDYKGAIMAFEKVAEGNKYFEKSLYNIAMSYAYMNEVDNAIDKFSNLVSMRSRSGVNDQWRVAGLMGLARTFYQKQNWGKSLFYYRQIPRDNEMWHESLFEKSWAELRAAKFRSTLGSFQSLHSDFYTDFYIPESLILRAIVYLYICKYDEIQKVLTLYETTYGEVLKSISGFIRGKSDPMSYYQEIERGLKIKKSLIIDSTYLEGILPYSVARHLINKGNISNNLEYLRKLYEEKKRLSAISYSFQTSSLGRYANQVLQKRIQNTKSLIGVRAKGHMLLMKAELKDLNEQVGFLKYELINLEKEKIKTKIASAGKDDEEQIDDELDRDYWVKNGYEYYPFRGEFWLDEIGNFFYLGKTSCEVNK